MERHRTVAQFWNWLPGFRAVAETEHLPTAADRVHVTPAALSRTVRLLEDTLGRELFHRRGRRLHLNEEGRVFLDATRMAMRLVHDAQSTVSGTALEGPIRIAAGGVGQVYAMRALLQGRQQLPGMRPTLLTPDPSSVASQLLRGDLDLVVASFVVSDEGLKTDLLTYAESSVYCGPTHALYGRATVGVDEIVQHPFTAPPADGRGATTDGWPSELAREILVSSDRMQAGLQICGSTNLLAVLPDAFAATSAIQLHRLPVDGLIPKTPVVATRREPTGADDLTERMVALLGRICGS